MAFEKYKESSMKKLNDAKREKLVDEPAMALVDEINAKKDYFTSSSCYGRVMLINFAGEKGRANFVERWHRTVSFDEVKKALDGANGVIWLRMEPLILHVSCRDVESAGRLLRAKERAGIKRGGIFSVANGRVQIEIEGTQRVESLVKVGGTQVVSDDYVRNIVKIANERFERNARDWEKLRSEIKKL
ncbi:hypothetical protein H0N95_00615 [Candidatus Micrarchaeota archaeon]|nr:hypothetical protein [Candidatus Micrarchaeota archaeon]